MMQGDRELKNYLTSLLIDVRQNTNPQLRSPVLLCDCSRERSKFMKVEFDFVRRKHTLKVPKMMKMMVSYEP